MSGMINPRWEMLQSHARPVALMIGRRLPEVLDRDICSGDSSRNQIFYMRYVNENICAQLSSLGGLHLIDSPAQAARLDSADQNQQARESGKEDISNSHVSNEFGIPPVVMLIAAFAIGLGIGYVLV
jgi:hypothetical protein